MKTRKHALLAFLGCWYACSFLPEVEAAEIIDPARLMRDVQNNGAPGDEVVRMDMKLIDGTGRVSRRSALYSRKRRGEGPESKKLIRFDSPAEMAGSGVLTLENSERADDQWMYLPAFHTSRKIPSSSRSDRYMGTDFFFEDVSDDKVDLYRYRTLGHEIQDGRELVLIEQVPVDEDVQRDSAYGRKVQWVDTERLLVARIDYFDKSGVLIKRFQAAGAAEFSGRWRWSSSSMTDLRINHRTEIDFREREIDTGLNERLFTVRQLERGR